jgi:hypothetical protein
MRLSERFCQAINCQVVKVERAALHIGFNSSGLSVLEFTASLPDVVTRFPISKGYFGL